MEADAIHELEHLREYVTIATIVFLAVIVFPAIAFGIAWLSDKINGWS